MASNRHRSPPDRPPPGGQDHTSRQQKVIDMETCSLCEEQSRKTHRGKPHHNLIKIDESRIFTGTNSRGHEEQDYRCLDCDSRFTRSNGKDDLAWTLWQA